MPRSTLAEKVAFLCTLHTQAEVARMLNASVRSVRRWKNEGVKPKRVETVRAVYQAANNARKSLQRQARKERAPLPRVAVPPRVKRVTRIDPSDPRARRRISSDTVAYDVRNMTVDQIRAILRYLRDTARIVRIIYRVPIGGTSIGGRDARGRKKTGRVYPKGGNASTEWERDFDMRSNAYIDELLSDVFAEHRRALYIMVVD